MLGITHNEVRRHPKWREELDAPRTDPHTRRVSGTRLLGAVALIIVATAVIVLLVKS